MKLALKDKKYSTESVLHTRMPAAGWSKNRDQHILDLFLISLYYIIESIVVMNEKNTENIFFLCMVEQTISLNEIVSLLLLNHMPIDKEVNYKSDTTPISTPIVF